jgi:hypothetical protein
MCGPNSGTPCWEKLPPGGRPPRRACSPTRVSEGSSALEPRPSVPGDHTEGGISYPDARDKLIRRGYGPATVVHSEERAATCRKYPEVCRRYPEVTQCSPADRLLCAFLYRGHVAGVYWVVYAETSISRPADPGELRCCGYGPADSVFRKDLQVLGPDGRAHSLQLPDDPTPLCSKTTTTNCWVKPPPGWREPPPH